MCDCASTLDRLLELDLRDSGWEPNWVPDTVHGLAYQHSLQSLKSALTKKLVFDDGGERVRDDKALAEFLRNNEDCSGWVPPNDSETLMLLNEARGVLNDALNVDGESVVSFWKIVEGLDLGPGANVGCYNVDFYSKTSNSPLSATSLQLLDYYGLAIHSDTAWFRAEMHRRARLGTEVVAGSKLTFALKNAEISRTIAEEPPVNMLFQKGIERLLNGALERVFKIRLSVQQEVNRHLAYLGSLVDGPGYVTLDLKSASNLNSLEMVRYMFPSAVVKWLEVCRSPKAVLPGGRAVEMHMVSTMGNAFTFPLQTMLFASVVVAAYRLLGIKPVHADRYSTVNYGVFGDDIICDPRASALVVRGVEALGHEINHEKSFTTGLFRESCGGDYYAGRNVRGVYLKRLRHDGDVYSAINRLNAWSGRHYVPLVRTIGYLRGLLKKELYVPLHEGDDAGIKCPEECLPAGFTRATVYASRKTKARYPTRVYKARVQVSLNVDVRSPELAMTQAHSLLESDAKVHGRARHPIVKYWVRKGSDYNSEGVLLSALAGKLRDGSFVLRQFRTKHRVQSRRSSCWNHVVDSQAVPDYGGFYAAYMINIVTADQSLAD